MSDAADYESSQFRCKSLQAANNYHFSYLLSCQSLSGLSISIHLSCSILIVNLGQLCQFSAQICQTRVFNAENYLQFVSLVIFVSTLHLSFIKFISALFAGPTFVLHPSSIDR